VKWLPLNAWLKFNTVSCRLLRHKTESLSSGFRLTSLVESMV
jgi:hypothetical protein